MRNSFKGVASNLDSLELVLSSIDSHVTREQLLLKIIIKN